MSVPRIRLDEAATEFERELLGSWQGEKPAGHGRERALALVGSGVAAGGATAATASTGALGGAIAGAAAPKAAALGIVAVGKWVAAGSLLVAGVVAVGPYLRRAEPARAVPPASEAMANGANAVNAAPVVAGGPAGVQASPATGELPAPASPAAGSPVAPGDVDPAPARAAVVGGPARSQGWPARASGAPRPSAAPVASAPALVAPASPSPVVVEAAPAASASGASQTEVHPSRALGDQVACIDRARSALAAGDAAQAVRAVDDYDARFPGGMLAQEAAVLRIDALVKLGRRDEAADLGQRFIATHPASPYAAKVRQSLAPVPSP